MAFCLTLCCHIARGAKTKESLEPFVTCALTVQCKFYVHKDRIETIAIQMQTTHNVSADNKALGLSSLQEAESILAIIEELQLTKPATPQGVASGNHNQEIKSRTNIHRAGVSPGVSAGGSDEAPKGFKKAAAIDRMLDLVIKIARVLQEHPTDKDKFRLLEQR